jgi:hypothetical protein
MEQSFMSRNLVPYDSELPRDTTLWGMKALQDYSWHLFVGAPNGPLLWAR